MKAWLQERLGLDVDPSAPLIGFVGRLTMQKGVDVLLGAAPALLAGSAPPPGPSRWRPPALEAADAAGGTAGAARQPGPEAAAAADGAAGGSEAVHHGPAGSSTACCSARSAVSPLRPAVAAGVGISNAAQSSQLAVPAGQPATAPSEPAVQLVLLGTGEVRPCWGGNPAGWSWLCACAPTVCVPSNHECPHQHCKPPPSCCTAVDGDCAAGPLPVLPSLRCRADHLFRCGQVWLQGWFEAGARCSTVPSLLPGQGTSALAAATFLHQRPDGILSSHPPLLPP